MSFQRAALLGFGLSLAACQGNYSDLPPVHLQQNMDFQDKLEAQERSEFFEDGRAMRPPPEGTVARGMLKADPLFFQGRNPQNSRLADALPPAVKMSEELLARGEERYNIYCAPCHDAAGTGAGPVTKHGARFAVQPPSYHQDKFRAMPLGHFYDVITRGKGTMSSYAAQIPEYDRWAIAAWVRTLQVHGSEKGWNHDAAAAGMAAEEGAGQ